MSRIRSVFRLMQLSGFHYFRRAMIRPPFRVSTNGQTCRIEAPGNDGSVACYAEVIAEDSYGLLEYAQTNSPKVIVDIGANIGIFSKFCSLLFPCAQIHAYEPNPTAQYWLLKNANGTNIKISPFAVTGDSSGLARFDTSVDSTIGRLSDGGDIEVYCQHAKEVAGGATIDLLKMDCEGGEWSILQERSLLRRTRALFLEYHLVHGHTLEELESLIVSGGHRIVSAKATNNWLGIIKSENEETGRN